MIWLIYTIRLQSYETIIYFFQIVKAWHLCITYLCNYHYAAYLCRCDNHMHSMMDTTISTCVQWKQHFTTASMNVLKMFLEWFHGQNWINSSTKQLWMYSQLSKVIIYELVYEICFERVWKMNFAQNLLKVNIYTRKNFTRLHDVGIPPSGVVLFGQWVGGIWWFKIQD